MKALRLLALLLCSLAPLIHAQSGLTRLGEFRVNTTTADSQDTTSVASDAAGNFVVVWESLAEDGSEYGIYWRLYNTAGSPIKGPVRANTVTQNSQSSPAVSMSPSGAFVIVWESDLGNSQSQVRGQRYDPGGIERGSNFDIFGPISTTALTDVAMSGSAGNERFVVARQAVQQVHDQDGMSIVAQRYFFQSGAPDRAEIAVNATGTVSNQLLPYVAMNSAYTFVVAWRGVDSNGAGVFARVFRDDNTSTGEISVPADEQSAQSSPSVALAEDGSFAVAFDTDAGSTPREIRVARFAANGTRVSDNPVNSFSSGDQATPSISLSPDGGITIAYFSQNLDGSGFGVAFQ